MELTLNPNRLEDYRTFLKIKSLPNYKIRGLTAYFPDEYAALILGEAVASEEVTYKPSPFLFDYQQDIAALALRKRKFAIFAECGLGKTLIFLEYARTVLPTLRNPVGLMVSPAMVVEQTIEECRKFYGDSIELQHIAAKDLQEWLNTGIGLGINSERMFNMADVLLSPSEKWRVVHGDCIEVMATMPAQSVDMSVFSPPFPSVYAYSEKDSDIGNSEDFRGDAKLHLSFFFRQLSRIVKPGRVVMVHVMQIPRLKRTGEVGLHDFRGLNIRLGERAGLTYEYDWMVSKNPQAQAIRTHSHELQFAGIEKDQARSRGCISDYLIKFRAPGDNAIPVENNVTRNEWIDWAEAHWSWEDIKATDTLNTAAAKSENDTRHICPLQLGVIRRLVRLFTNPDEIVFSPFAGIGSEGYESIKLGRRFYGIELKEEYHATACKNLKKAEKLAKQSEPLLSGLS